MPRSIILFLLLCYHCFCLTHTEETKQDGESSKTFSFLNNQGGNNENILTEAIAVPGVDASSVILNDANDELAEILKPNSQIRPPSQQKQVQSQLRQSTNPVVLSGSNYINCRCAPGIPGPDGDPGTPGTPGDSGDKGSQGIPGSIGSPGAPGDVGPQGPKGVRGQRGDVGPTGNFGSAGVVGPVGDPGPKGEKGAPGVTGPTGAPGVPGEPGVQGPPGSPGLPGIPFPG